MPLRITGTIGGFGLTSAVTIFAEEGPVRMMVAWGNGTSSAFVDADPDTGQLFVTGTYATNGTFGAQVQADFGNGKQETLDFTVRLSGSIIGPVTINGGDGIDLIAGGFGNDVISAGAGNDYAIGGAGNDSLLGGLGLDSLDGGAGNDTLHGEGGDDLLLDSGGGNDLMDFGDGNDFGDGGVGNDRMLGGAGIDGLNGGLGNDTVDGGIGNDALNGNAGNDSLVGGTGNDVITGGAGVDTILAGAGRDTVIGGPGGDRITLGVDGVQDRLHYRNLGDRSDVVTGFEAGMDKIYLAFLTGATFVSGGTPVAGGAGAHLLYDIDDGRLYVDMLGAGGEAPLLLATFSGVPGLSATDFLFAT